MLVPCNHLVTLTQHSSFTADGKVVLISLSEFPLVQSSLIISSLHVRPATSSSTNSRTVYLEVNLLLSLALALVEEGMDDPVPERVDGKLWNPEQFMIGLNSLISIFSPNIGNVFQGDT